MSQGTTPVQTATYQPQKSNTLGDLAKRLFDILIAALGLLFFSPLFLWIAYRIRRDSPGPVFYRGDRVGLGGRVFKIVKFRTMYEQPESYAGPRITAEDDPRITPFGRFLRDAKLNELPQLWNVLKGEMSLVGPRPEDPEVVAQWAPDIRAEILSVRPGITSPSSVRYRREEELLNGDQVMDTYINEVLPSKLRLDQLYVRQRSFWGDLDVLLWTTLVFLPRSAAYEPSDKRLFVGPLNELMRRYFSWFVVDILVALVAISIAGLLWRTFGPLDVGWRTAIVFAVGFALLCSLMGSVFGVQKIYWSRSSGVDALELLPVVIIATLITLFLNHYILMKNPENSYGIVVSIWNNQPLMPLAMIIMAAVIAYIGFVTVRYRSRLITGFAQRWVIRRAAAPGPRENVIIVGGGETGQFASWILGEGSYANSLQIAGFIDDDLFTHGTRIRGLKVLGGRRDISRLVQQHDIGIIIFAIHNIQASERQELLDICSSTGARVVIFPDIPAVIDGIASHKKPRKSAAGQIPPRPLAYELTTSNLSHQRVESWLVKLEETAKTGDLESLQAQIDEFRQQIRSDGEPQFKQDTQQGGR